MFSLFLISLFYGSHMQDSSVSKNREEKSELRAIQDEEKQQQSARSRTANTPHSNLNRFVRWTRRWKIRRQRQWDSTQRRPPKIEKRRSGITVNYTSLTRHFKFSVCMTICRLVFDNCCHQFASIWTSERKNLCKYRVCRTYTLPRRQRWTIHTSHEKSDILLRRIRKPVYSVIIVLIGIISFSSRSCEVGEQRTYLNWERVQNACNNWRQRRMCRCEITCNSCANKPTAYYKHNTACLTFQNIRNANCNNYCKTNRGWVHDETK